MERQDLLDGKRILIVDDEPDVLDTLVDLLPMCKVTKATSFDQARDLLERGCDGFIQKPFNMDELLKKTREILASN